MESKDTNFESIVLRLASPEDILGWSHGEILKPETINYRTQRAERGGLFCEKIFGPEKDWECYCGKYKKVRYKGITCEKCGVEVTRSIVRRERMGHIALAVPVSHIWFLRGIPSRIGTLLDVPMASLEKVIYFSGYIITKVSTEEKNRVMKDIDSEYKTKLKKMTTKEEKDELKKSLTKVKKELDMIVPYGVLNELDYHALSKKYGEIFEVGTGAEAIYGIFKQMNLETLQKELEEKIERTETQENIKFVKRLNLVKVMRRSGVRPEWMFLTILPVIPPDLRPMVTLEGGRHATSDLNDLYRRVINRNTRLKKLIEIKAPDVICRNEKRILQEAVDALIDNSIRHGQNLAVSQAQRRPLKSLADMLKGKQGRFRQNLLGKRVDYSARSVIVVGPELKMDQCGLPKYIALELFRPFVISQLLKQELAYQIRHANRLIDDKTPEVWAILEDVIKDKHVLLNRAPTLHRLGIQAFRPILVEGKAIQLHPLVTTAFNADFDGDQMSVHVPLSVEAQGEARDIMASVKNLLRPGDGEVVVNPTQDMVIGCYWLTMIKEGATGEGKYFSTPNEAIMAHDFGVIDARAKIKVLATGKAKYAAFEGGLFETTVGRLKFNSILPEDFPYVNEEIVKKGLAKIIHQLIIQYGVDATPPILDKIKTFGFENATLSGVSWGIDDLKIPVEKPQLIAEAKKAEKEVTRQFEKGLLTDTERYNKVIESWQDTKTQIEKLVPKTLDRMGTVSCMVSSAARGNWGQVGQMAGMKGLMLNPAGRVIEFPVVNSYKEGLNVLEYFITTHGARKGEVDTALKTAEAGYLTRRLVDVSQDVVITEEACSDKDGIWITRDSVEHLGKKFHARIYGRTLAKDAGSFKKGHLLSVDDAKKLDAEGVDGVQLFSPITCNSKRGVCQKCYGYDLSSNKTIKFGEAIGIVAAQAIGEPGTQLTMRTFHTGGIVQGGDITMGLPRVEEVFELRMPKSPAVLCEVDDAVFEIKTIEYEEGMRGKNEKLVVTGKKEYKIPAGRTITVKVGEDIKRGQMITDGVIDIKQLFEIGGKEMAQNYILYEVAKVYLSQGVSINEKHIEVVVRQMFSRYKVKDIGDTRFNKGEIVGRSEALEENEKMDKEGKMEAKFFPQVLPINRVAVSTPSFLSAASFQDTTRVLIKTALNASKDKLFGLKENVIIGRLIPAGTGYRKDYAVRAEEGEEQLMDENGEVSSETEEN